MPLCSRLCIILLLLVGLSVFFIDKGAFASDAETSVIVLLVCGDGYKDFYEICDKGDPPVVPADVGILTCQNFGYTAGELACSSDCSEILTTMCNTCPNGIKEGTEQCDGNDYGGNSCLTYGFNTGSIACTTNCLVNLMGCSSVGLTEPDDTSTQGGGGSGGAGGGASGLASGFDPGSETPPKETKVVISGKSYPNSDVHILQDGKVIGIVRADSKADFKFETAEVSPGVVSFGIWSEDKNAIKSTLLTLTFRVTTGAITTISGAYISPTIDTDKKSVKSGEILKIFGQTIPSTKVNVHVNSEEEIIKQIDSQEGGDWSISFDTSPLANEEFHTTKAYFETSISSNIIKSGFSRTVSFYVGEASGAQTCPGADLNKDKRVNLVDFSILLYNWGSNNACSDQNGNKKVDLIDFSIMLYNWTG